MYLKLPVRLADWQRYKKCQGCTETDICIHSLERAMAVLLQDNLTAVMNTVNSSVLWPVLPHLEIYPIGILKDPKIHVKRD